MHTLQEFTFKNHTEQEKIEKLVILIHGYAASGYNIMKITDKIFSPKKTLFIAPNAPYLNSQFNHGYYWFDIDFMDKEYLYSQMQQHISIPVNFINSQIAKYNLSSKDVVLVGFSQGSCVVNHIGLTSKDKFAGIISLSGGIVTPYDIIKQNQKIQSPFYFIHGDQDDVLDCSLSEESNAALKSLNINSELKILHNMAHCIDNNVINLISEKLKVWF